MRLVPLCQQILETIQHDMDGVPPDLPENQLTDLIRQKIEERHIVTKVLRTFAATYLFGQISKDGPTIEQLNTILVFEDQVTTQDVLHDVKRLIDERIIKERSERYLVNTN